MWGLSSLGVEISPTVGTALASCLIALVAYLTPNDAPEEPRVKVSVDGDEITTEIRDIIDEARRKRLGLGDSSELEGDPSKMGEAASALQGAAESAARGLGGLPKLSHEKIRRVLSESIPVLTKRGNLALSHRPEAVEDEMGLVEDHVLTTQRNKALRAPLVWRHPPSFLGRGVWLTSRIVAGLSKESRETVNRHCRDVGPSDGIQKVEGEWHVRADEVAKFLKKKRGPENE